MTTIYDIARKCGVSTATVSKVLNGTGSISQNTKDRVLATVKEMKYYPNLVAKNLVTNKSYTIGVMLHVSAENPLNHELFSSILDGFRNIVEQHDYDIMFISRKLDLWNNSYLEHCLSRRLEGVFCLVADYEINEIGELLDSEIPVVAFDTYGNRCDTITSDNDMGMVDIVNHLAKLGHRKIVFITGDAKAEVTAQRMRSFKKGLATNQIPFNEEMIISSEYYSIEGGIRETSQLLEKHKDVTAIIYPDDYTAIAGIKELNRQGIRVPEDISVVGYDGTNISQIVNPPLTTVKQDSKRIGAIAAKRLLERMANPSLSKKHVVIHTQFIEGSSTGKAKI